MPLVDLVVGVESNVDLLAAAELHAVYARMVAGIVDDGEDALRVNAAAASAGRWPDPTPGAMVEHVESVYDGDMAGEVGVSPVEEARARPYASMFESDPADYPLFRDQGTDPYGSPTGGIMRFEAADGPVFRRRVRGQVGAEFMLATFTEMTDVVVPHRIDIFGAELESALGH